MFSFKIKLQLALVIAASACFISCKDNMISNLYLNITENLRYDESSVITNENKVFKICVKDFYTGENITGAETVLFFTGGFRITLYSGTNGIIEIDKRIIPEEDFDVSVCHSKNNIQYFLKQRISYTKNSDRAAILYLISGICESNNK
ncbi:MAG: hypothetical protein IPL53_20425 [Ignavibacteria bacterium]|nr:hypothetical protein [Ignavibacteria bacterium]